MVVTTPADFEATDFSTNNFQQVLCEAKGSLRYEVTLRDGHAVHCRWLAVASLFRIRLPFVLVLQSFVDVRNFSSICWLFVFPFATVFLAKLRIATTNFHLHKFSDLTNYDQMIFQILSEIGQLRCRQQDRKRRSRPGPFMVCVSW